MILWAFLILVQAVLGQAPGCIPFGTRLALGRSYLVNPQSEAEPVSMWFNTNQSCPKSYTTVTVNTSVRKFYCSSLLVSFSTYKTYVHSCKISPDYLAPGNSFEYMVYGWDGNSSNPAIPAQDKSFISHLFVNTDPNYVPKIMVLADWGFIKKKKGIYDTLDNSFQYLLNLDKKEQVDVLLINGDVAYDLNSKNGTTYEEFMVMLSKSAAYIPTLMIPGNHERQVADNIYLFNTSFQSYGLIDTNITSFDMGTFSALIFDPYGIALDNMSPTHLLKKFKSQIQVLLGKKKPIVAISHYPVACSGTGALCIHNRELMADFWKQMVDQGIKFYVGAHYHTYDRLYPYSPYSSSFVNKQQPYQFNPKDKLLYSLVEGIAGNDKSIVESTTRLDITAALYINQTGYGMMQVNKTKLTYSHFSALDPQNPLDYVEVNYDAIQRGQLLREE